MLRLANSLALTKMWLTSSAGMPACFISASGAGDWADRLLPLPGALMGLAGGDPAEVVAGLRTTGHFLSDHLARSLGARSPLRIAG